MQLTSTDSRHFVLVHGAWHAPEHWAALRAEFDPSQTSTVDLPSTRGDTTGVSDMYGDAGAIRAHVRSLRARRPDMRITVVAHSYAGIPVSEGLAREAGFEVDNLIFVGAFLLDIGQSLLAAVGGVAPDWWQVDEDNDIVVANEPAEHFYGDLDDAATASAVAFLRPQRWSSFTQPLTQTAWRELPTSYVILDEDRAIPPSAQAAMAAQAEQVTHLSTSHSPFASRPGALANLIRTM